MAASLGQSQFQQPKVHHEFNIPFISLNERVFKITPDVFQPNSFLVGARNYIFRVNSSLAVEDWVQNGPLMDSHWCGADHKNCPDLTLQHQDNHIILVASDTLPVVITCGTALQGMCTIYAHKKLASHDLMGDRKDTRNYVASFKHAIAFAVSKNASDPRKFLVANEYDHRRLSFSPPAISLRQVKVTGRPSFQTTGPGAISSSLDIVDHLKENYPVNFVHGFHDTISSTDDGYSYIISNQLTYLKTERFEARIGRICPNDLTLRSYIELIMSCSKKNIATAAHFGKIGSELRDSLSITGGDKYLFVTFSWANEGLRTKKQSILCGIPMEQLNKEFDRASSICMDFSDDKRVHPAFQNPPNHEDKCLDDLLGLKRFYPESNSSKCFHNSIVYIGGRVALKQILNLPGDRITSLAVYTQKSKTLALMGTKEGEIIKAQLNSRESENKILFRQNMTASGDANMEEIEVRAEPVLTNDFALFAVSNRVVRFAKNSCSIYRCGECIKTTDPLGCGWCNGFCASAAECPSGLSRDRCSPVINYFKPDSGPLAGGTDITIFGDNFGSMNRVSLQVEVISDRNTPFPCRIKDHRNQKIICTIPTDSAWYSFSGPIRVKVDSNVSPWLFNTEISIQGQVDSKDNFTFLEPDVYQIHPGFGPRSGGVKVTVLGENLDIGSRQEVSIVSELLQVLAKCQVTSVAKNKIECITEKYPGKNILGYFLVRIDKEHIRTQIKFTFKNDPVIRDLHTVAIKGSSENLVKISGKDLDSIHRPILNVENLKVPCHVESKQSISCSIPKLNDSWSDGKTLPVLLTNDGVQVTNQPADMSVTFRQSDSSVTFVIFMVILIIIAICGALCYVWYLKKIKSKDQPVRGPSMEMSEHSFTINSNGNSLSI